MTTDRQVLLSAFADEASASKRFEEQLTAVAAVGLRRYTVRFIDLGDGVKNAIDLTPGERARVVELNRQFGLGVATLGSPIGKVKLFDFDDGTANRYVPPEHYLAEDVTRACEIANALGTGLIRGFSFYPPKGDDPQAHVAAAVDRLGPIAERCAAHGLVFGLEVEANLVGRTGGLLKEIHAQLADAALVLIYDVGNLITQGFSPDATYAEYEAMKPGLGWVHVKDYRPLTEPTDTAGYVEEDALSDYRAVDAGSGVYQRVIADLKGDFDAHAAKAEKLGLAGPLFDLEPHVRGGGQYGGYSGPDGLGVAMRALCSALEEAGCAHDRRGTVEPL